MFFKSLPLLLISSIFALSLAQPKPRVPWVNEATFDYSFDLSDEFNGNSLNENKWDPNGFSNPDTGCPNWNGPPSSSSPEWSTLFPGVTDPATGQNTARQYTVRNGKLEMFLTKHPLSYFTSREYYCDATTFKCNHNANIDCFATDFNGNPLFSQTDPTKFRGVVHDKCKIQPFCIPHPEFVTNKPRVYSTWAGTHITSRKQFKYGFVEARVKMAKTSSAVSAVWMHNDELVDGWCRYVRVPGNANGGRRLECPSLVRSRRWQEIDLLEAMNTRIHKTRYTPNIHLFTAYKGEFTSKSSRDNGDGSVGGGPIIIDQALYRQGNPSFSNVANGNKVANDWHYSRGSVYELDREWARKIRIIGVYWSPNEIRFYVDGKEVKRIKNEYIHQPMYLDISMGWNVQWGQEFPNIKQQTRKFRLHYVRHWQVFTQGGVEPSSSLPFDNTMVNGVDTRYGNKLLGVHGQFPVNDGLTERHTIPDPDGSISRMINMNDSNLTPWSVAGSGTSAIDYKMKENDLLKPLSISRQNAGFTRAGGVGNTGFSKRRPALSRRQKEIALARPDHVATVRAGGVVETVPNAEQTVFEFANPNENRAGWATAGGLGGI